ncbi:MAG: hypothetical protein Q8L86_02180 [Vicinamibacterales bacterium]|nr:hypothetical protein [Vicinamibacterales bacterium]
MSQFMIAVVAVVTLVGTVDAQQRRLVAPVRGEAVIEYTKPATKVSANEVVTVIRVKNVNSAPIAGLRIEENWYAGGNPVGGDTYRHPRPLPPDAVIEVTLSTPRRPGMSSPQYVFTHANGTIKPQLVGKLELTPVP